MKKKNVIICVSLILLLGLLVYMSRFRKCTASDFKFRSPVEATASGFTKGDACKKAITICTNYSSSKDCRIKD